MITCIQCVLCWNEDFSVQVRELMIVTNKRVPARCVLLMLGLYVGYLQDMCRMYAGFAVWAWRYVSERMGST